MRNLTDRRQTRLAAAFAADRTGHLGCAWTLKEMVRDLYEIDDRTAAPAALGDWRRWVQVYDMAEMTPARQDPPNLRGPELLALFDTWLTNGRTEGRNLIVMHVRRQEFGYRNPTTPDSAFLYRCA